VEAKNLGVVGRDIELARLQSLIDDLPAGRVVLLRGEPGIGKTTMLDSLSAMAEDAGAVVFRCRADELSLSSPYALLSDLLGAGFDRSEASLEHLLEWLDSRSRNRPFLLIVDDLQWADPDSVEQLALVVRRCRSSGGIAAIGVRSGDQRATITRFLERVLDADSQVMELAPLDNDSVSQILAAHRTSDRPEATAALIQSAGGNPFYAQLLELNGHDAVLLDPDAADSSGAPEWISEAGASLVRQRVRMLGALPYKILRTASVVGRRFRIDQVVRLSGEKSSVVLDAITAAAESGLLEAVDTNMEFCHDIVRQALCADFPPPVRSKLHRSLLDLYVADEADPAEAIPQLLHCNPTPTDVPLLLAACRVAMPGDQLQMTTKALALLPVSPDLDASVRVSHLSSLMACGQLDEAAKLGQAWLSLPVNADAALRIRSAVIRSFGFRGQMEDALATLETPIPGEDRGARASDLSDAAALAVLAADFRTGHELAERALSEGAVDSAASAAHVVIAWVAMSTGNLTSGLRHADEAVAIAGGSVDRSSVGASPLLARGLLREATGDATGAISDVRLDEKTDHSPLRSLLTPFRHAVAATALYNTGMWADAITETEAGLLAANELSVELAMPWLHGLSQLVNVYSSGTTGAAFEGPDESPGLGTGWVTYAASMERLLNDDDVRAHDWLRTLVLRGGESADRTALVQAGPDLVRACERIGDIDLANEICSRLEAMDAADDGPAHLASRWALGQLRSDRDAIAAVATKAAATRPIMSARAFHDCACLAARDGDNAAAREHGQVALATYSALGAAAMERRLRADLREFGISLRRGKRKTAGSHGWSSLTPTELEVLALVAEGETNGSIASQLVMSRRTVESHLSHVYSKLGINSRVLLVKYLLSPQPATAR